MNIGFAVVWVTPNRHK